MTLSRLLRALVLAAAAIPAAGVAQSWSDPGLGFGADAGLCRGASADGPSACGSLHVRYRLTGSLGIEGRLGLRRDTVEDDGGPLLDVLDAPLTGTGQLFFLPKRRVQPYLLAGAGLHVVRTRPEGRNPSSETVTEALFGLHAGAGVDVRTSRSSAVHLDARWVFLEPTALSDLEADGFDVKPGYLSLTLGVTFYR